MSTVYTLSEMAATLARVPAPTSGGEAKILRRLQNLDAKGLLPRAGHRIGDERETKTYDGVSLHLARVLLIMLDGGVDAAFLRTVFFAPSGMTFGDKPAPSQTGEGYYESRGGLRDAIRGVGAGEAWLLELRTLSSPLSAFSGARAEFRHQKTRPSDTLPDVVHVLSTTLIDLNEVFDGLPRVAGLSDA